MRLNEQQKKGRNQPIIVGAPTKLTYIGVLMLLLACAGTAAGATACTDYRCAQAAEVAA